jgi:SAM-dependent methyltransferase
MARYTYGDSDLAGDRLALVARLFWPTSEAFLRAASPREPDVALDLGCGPGYTTTLVHETAGARRTVGVDRSEAFARRARDRVPDLGFIAGDVASASLPIARADLVYARLLLAHLPDPPAVVARWSTILTIGGRVLVDDLEAIETDDDVFRRYLDDVALAVIRAQGGALFVGPALHGARDPAGLARVHDDVTAFTPAAAETARVFAMNLAVLTERGEVSTGADLASALEAIASGVRDAAPVRWRVRQLAWERTD